MTELVKANCKVIPYGWAQYCMWKENNKISQQMRVEGKKVILNQQKYLRLTLLLNSPQRKKKHMTDKTKRITTQTTKSEFL